MIRPILMASVFALAAPAFAQSTSMSSGGNMDTTAEQATEQAVTANTGVAAQDHSNHNMSPAPTTASDDGMDEQNADTTTDTGTTATSTAATDMTTTGATGSMDAAGSATMSGSTGATAQTGATATMGTTGAMAQNSSSTWAATGATVQPGNNNPEEDARGIAVLSAPAFVPAGWNGMAGAAMGGPAVDAAGADNGGSESYPACSATVTDNCLQAYERGRSR